MIPVQEVLGYIAILFPADVTALFWQVPMTIYFQYSGDFYEMVDGVAMGSSSSPVVANFYT